MTDITALPLPQVPGISIRADVHSSAPDMWAITIMMYYYYFHLSDFLSQTKMYSALQEMWTGKWMQMDHGKNCTADFASGSEINS